MNHHALLQCLPLLADVLGRAYGVTVEIGGNQAFTNGRVIRLPSLPAQADPVFANLVRGYIDHESAHIRDTNFDAIAKQTLTPLERHIWNAFEDWRVEEKLAALFPGCRQNFQWLIRHLFLEPVTQPQSPIQAVVNWLLLTVRRWHVPELASRCEEEAHMIDHAWPGLIPQLETILNAMHTHCPDSLACVDYARQVVHCLANTPGLSALISVKEADLPLDLGQNLQQILGEEAQQVGRVAVATIGQKQRTSLQADDLDDISRVTAKLRARLHGLLQATRLIRQRPSRKGRLDPKLLHAIAIGQSKVFLAYRHKPAINTAVHILLDASASMQDDIRLAGQCCYALAHSLDQSGISVGVTAFPGDVAATVVPILRHGERLHGEFLVAANGMTPLAEALWWVLQRLSTLREQRKIILIVTDGSPDNSQMARKVIGTAKALGVEMLGIGINASAITNLLPDGSVNITQLTELPSALFAVLGQALLGNRRAA